MTKKLSTYYWIHLVLILSTILLWFFPEEVITLHVPYINREYGLLEHIQLLFIGLCIVTLFRHVRISDNRWPCYVCFALIAFSAFIFLEEIDYGTHHYDWLINNDPHTSSFDGRRNLHNDYSLSKEIMQVTNKVALFVFMVLVPLMSSRLGKYQKYAPTKWFAWSYLSFLLIIFVLRKITGTMLDEEVLVGTQYFSEMSEMMIYYLWYLYVDHLYQVRKSETAAVKETKLQVQMDQA